MASAIFYFRCPKFYDNIIWYSVQIIMAKQAGGPKRGDAPAGMDED